MDLQSSEGQRLLLKYVSSYVTKMNDHKLLKGLILYKTEHSFGISNNNYSIWVKIISILFYLNIFNNSVLYSALYSIILSCYHVYLIDMTAFSKAISFSELHQFRLICVIYKFVLLQFVLSDIDLHDISGYTVGTQYLNNLEISSAEMTQYLCNIKMSSTKCLTKKYRVPIFNYVLKDKIVMKYINRPARFQSLTLTQYMR